MLIVDSIKLLAISISQKIKVNFGAEVYFYFGQIDHQ